MIVHSKYDRSIGVLTSGGLDSAALIAHYAELGNDVYPLYIQSQLTWENSELFWLKKFLRKINVENIKPLQELQISLDNAYRKNWSQTGKTPGPRSSDSAVFLPARNLLLITKGLLFLTSLRCTRIAIGTLEGNPFPDGQKKYFRDLSRLLSQSFNRPVHIEFPFRAFSKSQILLKYSHFPLHLSMSCINPKNHLHCGKCNKCSERRRSFLNAKKPDLTIYARG